MVKVILIVCILCIHSLEFAIGNSIKNEMSQENQNEYFELLAEFGKIYLKELTQKLQSDLNNLEMELDLEEKIKTNDSEVVTSSPVVINDTKKELQRLIDLRRSLLNKIETIRQKKKFSFSVPQDILDDIENFEFEKAENSLLEKHTSVLEEDISQIVRHFAAEGKLETLLQFALEIRNIKITQLILTAIWNEVKVNGEIDRKTQKQLIDAFYTEIINQPNAKSDLREEAERNVKIIFEAKVFDELEEELNCDYCTKAAHLVIDKHYNLDKNNKTNLLKYITTSSNFYDPIDAISYVYEMMVWTGKQEDPALFEFAPFFWNKKDKLAKEKLMKLMEKLPKSLGAIYMSPDKICIKNDEYQEYLYFVDDELFTWTPGGKDATSVWSIEKSEMGMQSAFNLVKNNNVLYGKYNGQRQDIYFDDYGNSLKYGYVVNSVKIAFDAKNQTQKGFTKFNLSGDAITIEVNMNRKVEIEQRFFMCFLRIDIFK